MVIHDRTAPPGAFLPSERRLINRLDTPLRVQGFLNRLPYNTERRGETLRSFRQVLRRGTVHCLEAALAAACILEQHGHPPLVMSLASADKLDHVIFVYRRRGRWGSVARSRDPGLHGRKPVFRSLRALAESYFDPYIDSTGRITGFRLVRSAAGWEPMTGDCRAGMLGGGAQAAAPGPQEDQAIRRAGTPDAGEVSGLSGQAQQEAAVLPRANKVDADPEAFCLAGRYQLAAVIPGHAHGA